MAGVTQANWDSGRAAKVTFQNAYRFTFNVEMEKGKYVNRLGQAKGFNLNRVEGVDINEKLPLDVLLRDRLNVESLVILKDGRLID